MSNNTITVRFFARLREELATDLLTLEPAPGLTAGQLLQQLSAQGGAWRQLSGDQPVMIAVNQTMARADQPLQAGDEIAFFPPVTGG